MDNNNKVTKMACHFFLVNALDTPVCMESPLDKSPLSNNNSRVNQAADTITLLNIH